MSKFETYEQYIKRKQEERDEKMPKEQKFDQNKLRMDLVPPSAFINIAKVMTFGAAKYSPNGWKTVEVWRYKAALLRHIFAYLNGEENDEESGFNHLDHALTNIVFIRELEGKKND